MTFPNRAGYMPGHHRRYPKCVAASAKQSSAKSITAVHKTPPRRSLRGKAAPAKTEGVLQQDLHMMLAGMSPAHGGAAPPQSMMTKEEGQTQVEYSRKRLMEDAALPGHESYQELLRMANNPATRVQPGAVDPFATAIEQMPTIAQSYQGFGASGDGFSGSDTSRSHYMEAVARQKMDDAAELVDDPAVKARYDQAVHHLHEWGNRRMLQQQQQQPQAQPQVANAEQGGVTLPSLSMSLSQVSPYALELAARSNVPKKRSTLTKLSKQLMHEWFEHNLHHPYPTEEEKEWLAQQGGITLEQVNNWFINTRGRKWKPMLNRLMAEKQAGNCSLFDKMVKKIEEPYHKL